MRMRWTLAILCFALGTSVAARSQTKKRPLTTVPSVLNSPPDANPQYFPKGIFRDSSDRGNFKDFKARWYSSYLRAMHEPSLSEASKDKTLVAYRFLWLRTFHHPIAIRLTIRPDGTGALTGKVTSGAGGYEAGVMTQNESVEVSRAQVQQFLDLLQKAAFWASQTEGTAGGNDGARWIMEGLNSGVYHIVDRWSPEKSDYAGLCLYLLSLSKIKVEAKDIY